MEILYLLIPISLVLVFAIGIFFRWAIRNGQFEDLEGPGYRILMDDDAPRDARVTSNAAPTAGQSPDQPTI